MPRPQPPAPASGAAPPLDDDWLQRTRLLVGEEGLARLGATNVLLVGLGGVGSYTAELLVRAGVGALTIVDGVPGVHVLAP
jgi:tRNA A37 threonylcarbamoyladenosine dehydratase